MPKLMLIDGNSLTYRAFFALPTDITLASGQVTNAVYGFTSMLLNLVRDHQPDSIGAAVDRPALDGRGVRPTRADVPPRTSRRLQGQPQRSARHPAPADGTRASGRGHV